MPDTPSNAAGYRKGPFWAFIDFLVLFSGISTRSNLSRTQRRPLQMRGIFLFRQRRSS